MRQNSPSEGYRPVGVGLVQQVPAQIPCVYALSLAARITRRDGVHVQGTKGAGVEELLAILDAVRMKHADMDIVEFNDDGTFKTNINQVRWRRRRRLLFALESFLDGC